MKITDHSKKKNRHHRRGEKGVALLIAILTLLLVSAIAAGVVLMSNTETSTSANFKDEQRAFFSAKAGFEEVRDRMSVSSDAVKTNLPTALPGSGSTGVLYVTNSLNSETVAPWTSSNKYADDEICKETSLVTCSGGYPSGTYYTSTTASNAYKPSSGAVMDWKWVRVQQKQNNAFGSGYYVNGGTSASYVCWNSTTANEYASASACASPNYPVYVLTTLAITASGSRRMVQAEVAANTTTITAPAALTMDGGSPSFSGGTSSQFEVSGLDVGGCGSAAKTGGVPAVGAIQTSDIGTVTTGIPSKTQKNYTGSGASTPDVENVSSGLATSGLQTVTQLQSLVSTLTANKTQPIIPSGGSITNPGALGAPQTIIVNGDLTMSGNTVGYGILVVTGTLTLKGTVQWNGLVLVVGKGDLEMNGTNNINGAVLIAKTLDPTTGNVLSTLGIPTYNVSGGGGSKGGVDYSASCLAQAVQPSTYHSVSMRELMN